MLIAHLSDSHLRAGPLGGERASSLHLALGRVLAQRPLPDCLVITGDIADRGAAEEYRAFQDVASGFPLPIHLAVGNHDDARAMRQVLQGNGYLGGSEDESYYLVDYPDARIVLLDSAVPGEVGGRIEETQLGWLDRVLAERPDVPAIVGLHHPPIDVGIRFLDGMGLADRETLGTVLDRHPQLKLILAGHVHRPIVGDFAGCRVVIAPSTYRQSELDLESDQPVGYRYEPPGLFLHQLDGDTLVSHLALTEHTGGTVGYF